MDITLPFQSVGDTQSPITFKLNNVSYGLATTINIVGSGLTANQSNGIITFDFSGVTGGGGGGSSAWGSITGTLSAQTDLQAALNAKAATTHSHAIADVTGLQAALDAKQAAGSYSVIGHTHLLANVTDVTMTVANLNSLDDGVDTTLHFHASDRVRANHTGTQLLSTISDVTITAANLNVLDDGVDTTLHFHAADRARANHTGTQLLATISDVTITAANLNTLDDGVDTTLHFHASDRARANHTGTQAVTTTTFTATARFAGRITAAAGATEELTGTQATTLLDLATGALKGLMSSADFTKLSGIAAGATVNSTDATLLNRANHTGTQLAATISDFNTAADARVTAGITGKQGNIQFQDEAANAGTAGGVTTINFAGAGVTATFSSGTLTVTIPGGGGGGNLDSLTDVVITTPSTGQLLRYDGTNWVNATVSGTGDVTGPASSLDGQIALFNSTTGKVIKTGLTVMGNNGELIFPIGASFTPPGAGALSLGSFAQATKIFPITIDPTGETTVVWPDFAKDGSYGIFNNGTTGISSVGCQVGTTAGTGTAKQRVNTNAYTKAPITEFLVTVAATTAIASIRGSGLNSSREIGFFFAAKAGPATGVATTTSRYFAGMINSTAAPTDVDPSTQLNCVGFGYDAADTNCQIFHNDGTATATKIDLGASFPVPTADRTQLYEVFLYAPQGGTVVWYRVVNVNTGAVATGSTATTKIPSLTIYLAPRIYTSVGGTSSVIGLGFDYMRGFDAK